LSSVKSFVRLGVGGFVPRISAGIFAGFILLAFALGFVPARLCADQEQSTKRPLTEREKAGKRLFLQRCSFCHLGMPTKYQTYAPVLHNEIIESLGDDAVKEKIKDGSAAMPGFKYTLNEGDIDCILAYLKTVKKEDVTHKVAKE